MDYDINEENVELSSSINRFKRSDGQGYQNYSAHFNGLTIACMTVLTVFVMTIISLLCVYFRKKNQKCDGCTEAVSGDDPMEIMHQYRHQLGITDSTAGQQQGNTNITDNQSPALPTVSGNTVVSNHQELVLRKSSVVHLSMEELLRTDNLNTGVTSSCNSHHVTGNESDLPEHEEGHRNIQDNNGNNKKRVPTYYNTTDEISNKR